MKSEKLAILKAASIEELQSQFASLSLQEKKLKFMNLNKMLKNSLEIRSVRRDKARVLTLINLKNKNK